MKFAWTRPPERGEQTPTAPHTATSRRGTRTALLPTAAAILALTLTACGNSGAPTGDNTGTDLSKLSPQQLLDKANQEGSVTFYTQFTEASLKPVVEAFHQAYPKITLHTLTLNVDDMVARITTEQRGGQYSVDVLSQDGLHMGQLIDSHAVTAYDPTTKPKLPPQLSLPKGFQNVAFITTYCIAYNPKVLKTKGLPTPTSFEDLTKPEWKGNFSMAPNGVSLLQALGASMGPDKALDLIKALGNNNPRLVPSHSQAVTQVQAGEPAATISYGSYAAKAKKATPDSVDFVNPVPLPTDAYMLALGKNAPHPAAARIFMNWFLSKNGQQSVVKALGFSSLREDADNNKTIWDPQHWTPAYTPIQSLTEYNNLLKDYKTALKAP